MKDAPALPQLSARNQKGTEMSSTYEKTVSTLSAHKTIAKHISDLDKVKEKSEDDKLNQELHSLILELQSVHGRLKNKSAISALSDGSSKEVKAIIQYCKNHITSKKPEWQILAERYGWTPPKS